MTFGPEADAPADPTRPDVKRAAREVRSRRAPKADEATRAKWRAKYAQRKARLAEPDEADTTERAPYAPDPASIAMTAVLARNLWKLSTLITHRRELTDEEAQSLGAALDPVLYKYVPLLDEYAAEVNLAGVVFMLWSSTAPPKPEPVPLNAELAQ